MQQQHGDRQPHNVAASQHDRTLALNLHADPVQQFDAALGRTGYEERIAALHREAPDIERVEAVHVLLNADGAEDGLVIDVVGEGQLDEDPVHQGIGVQILDQAQQFVLADIGRYVVAERGNADFFTGSLFHAHVGGRILALANQHRGQAGHAPGLGPHVGYFGGDFFTNGGGNGLAVDDFCGHDRFLRWRLIGRWILDLWRQSGSQSVTCRLEVGQPCKVDVPLQLAYTRLPPAPIRSRGIAHAN